MLLKSLGLLRHPKGGRYNGLGSSRRPCGKATFLDGRISGIAGYERIVPGISLPGKARKLRTKRSGRVSGAARARWTEAPEEA